ncbi:ABC transporter ATP-binding protein [Roseovarius sp. LXJ103]|uniref:ABC transporter ATP-binding protein n=1 Tax=Roseovarius carneus TaxID=2853164 RepID=UPI000D6071AD|nr:ABC transporter ATP-binding protein [Roseovarius carneus]MBZ8118606.1 ABC transporter ATP-binding protein [Roseovarius carneus]PWE35706.1 ABC transporter [Pelagicola sp. LXJ1103]
MTRLALQDFGVVLRGRSILQDVSLSVGPGELVGIIGPNGAGKTTLMRSALGLIPSSGSSSLAKLDAPARGRAAAWMPQAREIAWPVTVETLVALGRTPHLAGGARMTDADHRAVDAAIAQMDLTEMRARTATRLSGGEQARALIARALAQETPLLMADEPIAGLDPAHQIATMQIFAGLAAGGQSVIVSLHDLGLAARHCTRLIVIGAGSLRADGPPEEVLTPALIRDVFGITAHVQRTDQGLIFQPLAVLP